MDLYVPWYDVIGKDVRKCHTETPHSFHGGKLNAKFPVYGTGGRCGLRWGFTSASATFTA
jgi:hypothetical protein